MNVTHQATIDKAAALGLTVQPYVIIIVDIFQKDKLPESFVLINDTQYKLETPLKAIDTCFKIFFTLNYEYPVEAEQIWLFVQKYFFEITTTNDKHFQSTTILLNDFDKYQSTYF